MMIVGLTLVVAGLGLPPLAELIPTMLRTGWLLVTYSLAFLGAALYLINADVFLMGATSPTERSHVFSTQVALWPLAGFAVAWWPAFCRGSLHPCCASLWTMQRPTVTRC